MSWGGGCLRQEGQIGQSRVEVKGGGEGWRERTQVGRFPGQGGEQICVCTCVSGCVFVCVHFPCVCRCTYFCI